MTAGAERVTYRLTFGTFADAVAMIGVPTEPRVAGTVVSAARVQQFAALVRDPNPAYWDADVAERTWGGLLAPPGMLMSWVLPPPWVPGGRPPAVALVLRIPLPGTTFVNASNEAEFIAPVRVGDLLTISEELVSVSPEKTTRLGVGHFVETLDTFRRADGDVVARNRNTLFRFIPHDVASHDGEVR